MQALPSREKYQSAIDIMVRWWRKWSETDTCLAEPQSCRADRIVCASEDMGLSALEFGIASELRLLASHGPEEANLLLRRMAALGLDSDEVVRLEPGVFRNLSWRCMLCESQGRCAWDLADDFAVPEWRDCRNAWRDYCPNAAILSALGEIPWFQPANGSSSPLAPSPRPSV